MNCGLAINQKSKKMHVIFFKILSENSKKEKIKKKKNYF